MGDEWEEVMGDVKSRQPQTKQIQMESLHPNGGRKESHPSLPSTEKRRLERNRSVAIPLPPQRKED